MNLALTDLHKKRFEWAFHAKREFLDQFIRIDLHKVDSIIESGLENTDQQTRSFHLLTKLQNVSTKERMLELEDLEKEIEKLYEIITVKRAQINEELNFFHMKNHEFSSKIENYKELSICLERIIQEMNNTDMELLVKEFLKNDLNHKKASVLNRNAIQLQVYLKKKIETQLTGINEKAYGLNILQASLIKLPELDPIPKIQQKIDAYWLTGSYEKAYNRLYKNAIEWAEQMFQAYQGILTLILNETTHRNEQFFQKVNDIKWEENEKIKKLHNEMAQYEKKSELLQTEHVKVDDMWKQDYKHSKQLQVYFIKHWLQYKQELQHQFLAGNQQERWILSQYMQLLQQDGEKIIESMNI